MISTIICKERYLMLKAKKIMSVLLSVLILFSLTLPVFAEAETEEKTYTFTPSDAESVALTAAKSKMILEGLPNDLASDAYVTRVSFNEETDRYKVIVRAERKYKYTCYIATNTFLGREIGFIADSSFEEQNIVKAFFGQMFEKIAYFFYKKFA